MTKQGVTSAVYAGSFDPPTLGHLDIYRQAAKLFDGNLVILIATNPKKKYMFTAEERKDIWTNILLDETEQYWVKPVIHILPVKEFAISYASELGCTHLVRGLRNGSDLEEEITIYDINKTIDEDLTTVYLLTTPALRSVSSSMIKGLIGCTNGRFVVGKFVPNTVLDALDQIDAFRIRCTPC